MAQFSTATFQLHRATAFHCLISMRLSISICLYKNLNVTNVLLITIPYPNLPMIKLNQDRSKLSSSAFCGNLLYTQNMSSITPFASSPLSFQATQGLRQNISPRSLLHGEDHNQRKRLFVRKPCASPSFILADKKRKQPTRQEFTNEANAGSFRSTREKELMKENRERSQNDDSFVGEEKGQNKQVSWRQEMFFKPSLSQNQLLSGLKYIQKKSFRTDKQQPRSDTRNDNKKEMDQTTDYSGQSLLHGCKSINTIRYKPSNLENTRNSDAQKFYRIPVLSNQNQEEKWCINCRNNKQKCELLTQRCAKLEEQLQLKNKTIKEIAEKIEQLRVQRVQKDKDLRQLLQNDEEMRQIIENLQRRAAQSEQQFAYTFEAAKKQLQRLNEKIKYSEMENTMLLRYKEEYCMMAKECDKYRHENDGLKRQLNNIARMDSNFNFSKQKQKYPRQSIPQTDRHKVPKVHIPQSKEEDAISLDLSQWSVQQHD